MEIMSNILTMKIFHGYQSFLKESLVFKNMRRKDRKLNVTPKRKKNNLFKEKSQTQNLLKTDKTTENVARYVRRMDTYPVGSVNQVILLVITTILG